MFSCDTIAICSACSEYGKNIFAKNSDRPTGEPQPLCFYEGREYEEGAFLQITHLKIPQVRKTYSVVGSRPYWIWGFEMGYNEKGLIIGNEAECSRMDSEIEDGILGMDLLRIALERASNVKEAISVITELLEKYGQKAQASVLFERTYENSFILVDKKECYVLETAGREWVAKEIKGAQGISNCYCIETEFDITSEKAQQIAREKRWLSPDEPFNFAKAYSGRIVNQPMGIQRFRRLNKLLAQKEVHNFDSLAKILRDHHNDEIISPRFGETTGTFLSICMHMRDWTESETSASLIAMFDEEIGVIARFAPAQTCLSAYIPVYMVGALPERMQKAERYFDEESLWWALKVLSLLVLVDENAFLKNARTDLERLEYMFNQKAKEAEDEARKLIRKNKPMQAKALLMKTTEECTEILYEFAKSESKKLSEIIAKKGGIYGRQKEVIEKYIDYSEIKGFPS